jgi:hypothetical protein
VRCALIRLVRAGVVALTAQAVSLSAGAAEPVAGRFALDRWEPAPIGDRFFSVASGAVDGELVPRAGVSFDYAHEPLVLRSASGDVLGSAVSSQAVTHVGASLALWDRLLVSLSVPLVLVNTGESPAEARSVASSPSGASLGDARIGARVEIVGARGDRFELGLGNYLWLPTGDPSAYTGDRGMRSMPHVAFGAGAARVSLGAHLGLLVREKADVLGATVGTAAAYGVAAGLDVVPRRLVLGAEAFGATVLATAGNGNATGAEVLGFVKTSLGSFVLGAAAGPGFGSGPGTPAFRALATLQWVGPTAAN